MIRSRIASSSTPIASMSSGERWAVGLWVGLATRVTRPPGGGGWGAIVVRDDFVPAWQTGLNRAIQRTGTHARPASRLRMVGIITYPSRARARTGTVGGMFEYFTGPKYVWTLGVFATLNN